MSGPLLQIRDLEVTFRTRRRSALAPKQVTRAVNGVDLDVSAGECVALVGESGSGKSTLARAVVGLVRPSGGSVRFGGVDITGARGRALRDFRREVQMVFQDPYSSVNPRFTVQSAIAEPLENHTSATRTERAARVRELLARVNLAPDLASRPVSALSGGQLQRVGIARALALDPQVLIADEPVSALDVSVQAQILELLEMLKERDGIASIFITHNLAVAEYVADRIAVMFGGRIVETGTPTSVVTGPVHPYTRELIASAPGLERRGRLAPAVGPGGDDEPGGCDYRGRCVHATDVCRRQVPVLAAAPGVGHGAPPPDHRVRCHRAGELVAQAVAARRP